MENSMALIRTQLLKLITTHFTEPPGLKFRKILPKTFPLRWETTGHSRLMRRNSSQELLPTALATTVQMLVSSMEMLHRVKELTRPTPSEVNSRGFKVTFSLLTWTVKGSSRTKLPSMERSLKHRAMDLSTKKLLMVSLELKATRALRLRSCLTRKPTVAQLSIPSQVLTKMLRLPSSVKLELRLKARAVGSREMLLTSWEWKLLLKELDLTILLRPCLSKRAVSRTLTSMKSA